MSTGDDLSVSEDAEVSDTAVSESVRVDYGVPQGSVLGPLFFFVFYINYIGNIIRQYGIKYHVYVDDIQLHISFDPKDENASNVALAKLSACINMIDDIHLWRTINMLKLNNSKTEFFVAASPHNLNKLQEYLTQNRH